MLKKKVEEYINNLIDKRDNDDDDDITGGGGGERVYTKYDPDVVLETCRMFYEMLEFVPRVCLGYVERIKVNRTEENTVNSVLDCEMSAMFLCLKDYIDDIIERLIFGNNLTLDNKNEMIFRCLCFFRDIPPSFKHFHDSTSDVVAPVMVSVARIILCIIDHKMYGFDRFFVDFSMVLMKFDNIRNVMQTILHYTHKRHAIVYMRLLTKILRHTSSMHIGYTREDIELEFQIVNSYEEFENHPVFLCCLGSFSLSHGPIIFKKVLDKVLSMYPLNVLPEFEHRSLLQVNIDLIACIEDLALINNIRNGMWDSRVVYKQIVDSYTSSSMKGLFFLLDNLQEIVQRGVNIRITQHIFHRQIMQYLKFRMVNSNSKPHPPDWLKSCLFTHIFNPCIIKNPKLFSKRDYAFFYMLHEMTKYYEGSIGDTTGQYSDFEDKLYTETFHHVIDIAKTVALSPFCDDFTDHTHTLLTFCHRELLTFQDMCVHAMKIAFAHLGCLSDVLMKEIQREGKKLWITKRPADNKMVSFTSYNNTEILLYKNNRSFTISNCDPYKTRYKATEMVFDGGDNMLIFRNIKTDIISNIQKQLITPEPAKTKWDKFGKKLVRPSIAFYNCDLVEALPLIIEENQLFKYTKSLSIISCNFL